MSKWEKLLAKLFSLSPDLRFSELEKILNGYCYEMKSPSKGSSHYTFREPGSPPITIPKHSPIKKVYIELVKKAVEREEQNNEEIR